MSTDSVRACPHSLLYQAEGRSGPREAWGELVSPDPAEQGMSPFWQAAWKPNMLPQVLSGVWIFHPQLPAAHLQSSGHQPEPQAACANPLFQWPRMIKNKKIKTPSGMGGGKEERHSGKMPSSPFFFCSKDMSL